MARSSKKRSKKQRQRTRSLLLVVALLILLPPIGWGAVHYLQLSWVQAATDTELTPLNIDPNFGVKNKVIEFFEANDAAEMIPIIRCESHFRHFGPDGSVLQNKSGSSAIGVAQIMTSHHPDPKILYRYNKRYDMDLTADDFDLTTPEGNLGYALVLYKVNGVKDWECSKRFRF